MSAPQAKGGKEMANLICPNCHGVKRTSVITVNCEPDARMLGIVKCLCCGHEVPITINKGFIEKIDIALPGAQSENLMSSVPADINEDIQETERANYAQCYKACVTMCRRALQLELIDRGIADAPLQLMLKKAANNNLLSGDIYNLATSIKGYGDIGAHRREQLQPQEVNMVIYATVRMLNEIFQ